MKILILEDDKEKLSKIISELKFCLGEDMVVFSEVDNLSDFISLVSRDEFNLIVFDIMVPYFSDDKNPENIIDKSMSYLRRSEAVNYNTPVIAITSYGDLDKRDYDTLNKHDINIIKYNEMDWEKALHNKANLCKPKLRYDFVIVCALEKEASAYKFIGYEVSDSFYYQGLDCRTIKINDMNGVIVLLRNMGLVQSAISTTKAIEMFEPKLVTMSGICAGINGKSKIYDIIIPESCDQHDIGKWTDSGFEYDSYSTALDHQVRTRIKAIIEQPSFKEKVKNSVSLNKSEYAGEEFDFDISIGILSSGNSVVASEGQSHAIAKQHRKKLAFEMEIYSLYESANQSVLKPIFFSAKSVVDDGSDKKSDDYQRVASLISAKTVSLIINCLM